MTPSTGPVDYSTVRDAYDAVAADYAEHLPDTRAESALDLAVLDHFAASVAGRGQVLDAGCGAGRMTRHLADRGCAVEGVDLSPAMVAAARRVHPDLTFTVGSLDDLPHRDAQFAGLLLWYSTIHTPPEHLDRIFAEAVRVLSPGGHLLVAFQAGHGTRDVGAAYRRFGHDVHLLRHLTTADAMGDQLRAAGLTEDCCLVRAPQGAESEHQAVVLAHRG